MRCLFLAILLLAAAQAQAQAATGYSCEYYFADSEPELSEVRELLETVSPGAIKLCANWGDPKTRSFFFVSVPLHHPFGVCQVTKRQLFNEDGKWTHTPPPDKPYLGSRSVSMLLAEGDCPRQDDPRYIATNDVSPGVFLAAVRLWEKLSSAGGPDILDETTFPGAGTGEMFREFESQFGLWKSFKLVSVSFRQADAHSPAYFTMTLNGAPTNWLLVFDVVDDGLAIVGIGTVEY
jgi:hypothetical protein